MKDKLVKLTRDHGSQAADHGLALGKAALGFLAGPLGGLLASLIGDYVPTSRQRAMRKGLELLRDKVDDIKERVDEQLVNKEDFADLFSKYEALAAKTNREEKLRAGANILANALLPPTDPKRSPYEELERLMHCADTLTSGAIAVLGASIKVRPRRHASQGDTPFSFKELRQLLPNMEPQLIMGLAAELRGLNLLHITEGLIGSPSLENYQFRVTPLGSRFAERIIEGRM